MVNKLQQLQIFIDIKNRAGGDLYGAVFSREFSKCMFIFFGNGGVDMNPFALMQNIVAASLFCPFDELPVGFFGQVFKLSAGLLVTRFSIITTNRRPIL